MKKIFVLFLIVLAIYVIYKVNDNELIDYMSIGDSINQGINAYGNKSFGYNDYIRTYLENNDLLHKYNSYYSKDSYTISELVDDINSNKEVLYDDKIYNIKKELREADLVTISIGMDELIDILANNNLYDFNNLKVNLDKLSNNMEQLIKTVTSLSKGAIVLIGYYNPYNDNSNDIARIFAYLNDKYEKIAKNYNITYVDIYNQIKKNEKFLPNPSDYHLTSKGYLQIASEVIKKIEKTIS